MDGPRHDHTKWSKSEKDEYHMLSLIRGIWSLTQMSLSTKQQQAQRTDPWLPRGRGQGRAGREFGVNRCKLLYGEWINNKVLLSSTGNDIQSLATPYNGRDYTHVCIVCVCAHSLQSWPTLCDPVDCSPPGSCVHGLLQARILEWVAMPSSRGSSWPRDHSCISCTACRFFTTEPPLKPHICITSWQIEGEKVKDFIFLGSKITADGDCSHEIKRCLLLRWKAMTNLDSILKSKDITLLIKVHRVKTIVFPVVMYGCESWTIKKAEHQRIDALKLWCWRRLLSVPWTARRSNFANLKETSPEYSMEELTLKLNL